MKQVLLTLVLLTALPATGVAGTAFIPIWYAFAVGDDTLHTVVHVVNVSNVEQSVTLTFIKADGSVLASSSVTLYVGGTQSPITTTDQNGEVTAVLEPLKLLSSL